jgi:hypothetical protein
MKFTRLNIVLFVCILLVSCSQNAAHSRKSDVGDQVTLLDISTSPHTSVVALDSTSIALLKAAKSYDNPYSPNTDFRFIMSENAQVQIELYDIVGNLRVTWMNQGLSKGTYKADFSGLSLEPSVYFYKLIVNVDSVSRGMILW